VFADDLERSHASVRYVESMRQLLLADRIEVKESFATARTSNLFVEVASGKTGRASGVMASTASSWAFVIGSHQLDNGEVDGIVIMVPTDRLRAYCVEAIESHSPMVRTWPNVGVLLPLSDLLKLC
jgi:hypothetical protein